jgi:hypothetical protein
MNEDPETIKKERDLALGKLAAVKATLERAWAIDAPPDNRGNQIILAALEAMGTTIPVPDRHTLGDGKRFHYREANFRYEIYSPGLELWAECRDAQQAETVASALERYYDAICPPKVCGWRGMAGGHGCMLHEAHAGPHKFPNTPSRP